jgi:hypothetical protein
MALVGPRGMSMNVDNDKLRLVFDLSDVGWMFDQDAATRVQQVVSEMADLDTFFEATFHRPLKPTVAQAIFSDVTRFKPLVQTFAAPMTTPMRTMVFCVLDGAQIKGIRFEYRFKAKAVLDVEVQFDSGEAATFSSDDLWDAEVLRHFGLMKLSGKPVVDGYFAFRKQA